MLSLQNLKGHLTRLTHLLHVASIYASMRRRKNKTECAWTFTYAIKKITNRPFTSTNSETYTISYAVVDSHVFTHA